MNSVNCTATTNNYCKNIHRNVCSTTTNTCGKCFPGYVSVGLEDIDSNLSCMKISSSRSSSNSSSSDKDDYDKNNVLKVGQKCNKNQNCITNYCVHGICSDNVGKTCPNNCNHENNGGTCVYYQYFNSSNMIDTCNITDFTCIAKCKCNTNFYGSYCDMNYDNYQQSISLRNYFCEKIYETIAIQDVTNPAIIKLRSTTIKKILLFAENYIFIQNFHYCISTIINTINLYSKLACDTETLSFLFYVFDKIISTTTTSSSSVGDREHQISLEQLYQLSQAYIYLTKSCQLIQGIGIKPYVKQTEYIKFISTLTRKNDVFNDYDNTYYLPQSNYEIFTSTSLSTSSKSTETTNSESSSSISSIQIINTDNLKYSDYLSLNIYQFRNNLFQHLQQLHQQQQQQQQQIDDVDLKSLPIYIDINKVMTTSNFSKFLFKEYLPQVSVTLENFDKLLSYPILESSNLTIKCDNQYRNTTTTSTTSSYNITSYCPNGKIFTLSCPFNSSGVYNVTCPGYKTIPQCLMSDHSTMNTTNNNVVKSSYCEVKKFNSHSTTCHCNLQDLTLSSSLSIRVWCLRI